MTALSIIADDRWIGTHGIGRFAKEVLARIEYTPLNVGGNPAAPLDIIKSSMSLRFKHKHSDYFFTPGYNPVIGHAQPLFITIHDLIHLDVEDESSRLKKIYYQTLVLPALHRAKKVFTVSHYSKSKILEWSNINDEKVIVVGNGVDDIFFQNSLVHKLNEPYFFYVGNQKPHKNLDFMIRAFARSKVLNETLLALSGTLSNSLKKLIVKLGIESRIIETGFIKEKDLPAWYRGAQAVVMPSLYEGFGLPLIEAMASDTLVLSSNSSCLPEVAGDAAIYFDPYDQNTLVNAFELALSSNGNNHLKDKGRQNAKKYNWDNVASKIYDGFEIK